MKYLARTSLCVLVWLVCAQSLTPLFRYCSLHDQGGRSLCRLPEENTIEVFTKHKKALECSLICELMNSKQPNYTQQVVFNYTDYFSKVVNAYPSVNMEVKRNDDREVIHVSYDDFFLTLHDYPPIPSYEFIDFYNACSGFNFFSNTGVCQLFAHSNETGVVSFDSSLNYCRFYKKIGLGSCFLRSFYYEDCHDVPGQDEADNGIYWISINNIIHPMYCIFIAGNKYTAFQRRVNAEVDFNRNWESYKRGFGDVKESFWLGNEMIHALTNKRSYKMRLEMESFDGETAYQEYSDFVIHTEQMKYQITHTGSTGTAGNGLYANTGFSTPDQDNDRTVYHCGDIYSSGWWFHWCHAGNLNNLYLTPDDNGLQLAYSICWKYFKGFEVPMKYAAMMLTRM